MDDVRLLSYSMALCEEFTDDGDTVAVLKRLSRQKREEFEPKIPELGDLLAMVRRQGSKRRIAQARADRQEAERREAMERQQHPENYVTFAEIYREVKARIAAKRAQG